MLSPLMVGDLHVAVGNITPFSTAMETEDWVPCALLSSCTVIRAAVHNINVCRSSCKASDIFVRYEPNLGFPDIFS
jgi:hypothetical protein